MTRLLIPALVFIFGLGAGVLLMLSLPTRERPGDDVLPDVSGLAWVGGDTLVAVHDAKRIFEAGHPRVSLLVLPDDKTGLRRLSPAVNWPAGAGEPNDLESIAHIPGTRRYLLVESGSDTSLNRRIFVANVAGGNLTIERVTKWPVAIRNVEGTAVARVGERYVFLYAERAHGKAETRLSWASFDPGEVRFGTFRSKVFRSPGPGGSRSRPVSALEVDGSGRILVASTVDPDDVGPFRSVIWNAGMLIDKPTGPEVVLREQPEQVSVLDGLKVESLALRNTNGGTEAAVGTDDEAYGALVRRLELP